MTQLPVLVKTWIDDPKRDHWEGLSILAQLTNNRTLIRNLTKKDSKYNREKLFNEIKKLSKDLPSITTPLHTTAGDDPGESGSQNKQQPAQDNGLTDAPPADHPGGIVSEENLPPFIPDNNLPRFQAPAPPPLIDLNQEDAKTVEDLHVSLKKMFNLKGMLANSLRDFKDEDNAGRKAVIDRIADIKKSMEAIQEKLDHFKIHGVLPALVDPPAPSVDDKLKTALPDDPVLLGKRLLNERSNLSKLKNKIANGHSKPEKVAEMEQALIEKTELVNEIQRRLNGSGS